MSNKLIYLLSTGLLTLLILYSVFLYFFDYESVSQTFITLGYPVALVYPLAIAKILGLVAIWSRKFTLLKQWAYAGFFFDFLLALSAHVAAEDGEYFPALIAMVLLAISLVFENKTYGDSEIE